jgi:PBP1b-binding outer membrane lipoprotein LpoB
MKTKKSLAIWSLSVLLGVVLLAGCSKKETAEEQPAAPSPAAPAATPIDPAQASKN